MSALANPELLNTGALYGGALFTLLGVAFMAKCKVVWQEIMLENGKKTFADVFADHKLTGSTHFKKTAALTSHALFMLGNLAFGMGVTSLTLALFGAQLGAGGKLGLAVAPGVTSVAVTLLFMAVTGNGITGIPGLSGPPMPVRVIVMTVAAIAIANAYLGVQAGVLGGSEAAGSKLFLGIYAFAVAVPQLFGLKHRSEGWLVLGGPLENKKKH